MARRPPQSIRLNCALTWPENDLSAIRKQYRLHTNLIARSEAVDTTLGPDVRCVPDRFPRTGPPTLDTEAGAGGFDGVQATRRATTDRQRLCIPSPLRVGTPG